MVKRFNLTRIMLKISVFLKQNSVLILILLVSLFLRFYHLDIQSPWLDEILTLKESDPSMPFKEFKDQVLLREGMPHLYFFIIRTLGIFFEYDSYTARFFSAIIGFLITVSIYFLGKKIYNKNVGILAALLITINWFAILYSQEARPYNLLVFFIIISFTLLVSLIKKANFINSIVFGIITGLVIHSHMIGLITIFSQYCILLGVFIIEKEYGKRLQIIKFGLLSFITMIIVAIPTYKTFLKAMEYKSGWLTLPGADGMTLIFHHFFGNTELLYFIFSSLILFFCLRVFKLKNKPITSNYLINNKLFLSFFILFIWIFISIILPIIKSYTSEPMITTRYFFGILPALMIIIAIAIENIKNKVIKSAIIVLIVTVSLIDLFLIKDYYNSVSKTQFREVSESMKKFDSDKDKIVSAYGWVLSYFFDKEEGYQPEIEMTFENYIHLMKTQAIDLESFWYFDGNFRPYNIPNEDEVYLKEYFINDKTIEKQDCWAKHYQLKDKYAKKIKSLTDIQLKDFSPKQFDEKGNYVFLQNGEITTDEINIENGNYKVIIKAQSFPEKPINGENAHIILKVGNKTILDNFVSEKNSEIEKTITFNENKDKKKKIKLIFDNDILLNNQDRNLIIYSIKFIKN